MSENQVLYYLAGEKMDSAQVRRHLDDCPECRESVSALQQELAALHRIASECTPRLRLQPAPVHPARKWVAAPAAGPVFAIVLLVILALSGWSLLRHPGPSPQDSYIVAEMAQDKAFLLEIQSLEERAFNGPGIGFPEETEPGFSEEFVDFIVPLDNPYTGSGLFDNSYRGKTQTKENIT